MNCCLVDTMQEPELSPGQNAVHIAMRTMKERCYLLQRRLNAVEEENIQLTIQCGKSKSKHDYSDVEIKMLNANIAQLTKEKSQLAHHIFMVACENKKLWSRLSGLTKSNTDEKLAIEIMNEKNNLPNVLTLNKESGFTVPQLIRSQTFTQSSPNPKPKKARIEDDNIEASLEEISLKLISSFLAEKSELVQQYEQMVELQMADDKAFHVGSIGFTYPDDLNCNSIADIKNRTDKLNEMKKEALRQQSELKNILTSFEELQKGDKICSKCEGTSKNVEKINESKKAEYFDTSDNVHESLTKWATPANSTSFKDEDINKPPNIIQNTSNESEASHNTEPLDTRPLHFNTLKDKQMINKNGPVEKICPMCGERFLHSIEFQKFQRHVENHFIGDEEYDSISENFEVITGSIRTNFQ